MAGTVRKHLGQSVSAAAGAATTLYTVPAATDAVVSTISATETNGVATTIQICVSGAGTTGLAAARAIVWNLPIAANQTIALTLGITLQAGGVLVQGAGTANVTFNAFGQENS